MHKFILAVFVAVFVATEAHHGHNHEPAARIEPASLRAIVHLSSPGGHDVHGNVTFTQINGEVRVEGVVYGMAPGQYGFHVHEKGDITGGCLSTGSHFNPEKRDHGHPSDENRHVGDLGNIEFNTEKLSYINFTDKLICLDGPHNILGRALVLHAMADDFGRSSHPDSKKTGNAGGRVACGVIGILSPITGWERSEASRYTVASVMTILLTATTFVLQ